jgi:hypothetical protein
VRGNPKREWSLPKQLEIDAPFTSGPLLSSELEIQINSTGLKAQYGLRWASLMHLSEASE